MSISDSLMLRYYELLTDQNLDEVKKMPPRQAKVELAKDIVKKYYGKTEAGKAEQEFEKVFVSGELPEKVKEIRIREKKIWVVDLLVKSGLAISKNEAKRFISQGSVKINKKRIEDSDMDLMMDREYIVQVGKRKFRKIMQG